MTRSVVPLMPVMLALPLLHSAAHAASPSPQQSAPTPQMRTYVSGTGNDNNSCSATAPCRTFARALTLTQAGGEIYVLSSADYGPVTINKSVSITSEGAIAGILTSSGTAITISAGANDVVNLRGLDVDGGGTGSVGIQFTSGQALNIQKTTVRGFATTGINFAPTATSALYVGDSTLTNNRSNGLLITAGGSSTVNGALNRVTATANGVGIFVNGANARVTMTDMVTGSNNYGVGASASAVMVRNSTVSNNAVGIAADQNAIVRVGQTTITSNGVGWQGTNGGQVQTYANNNVSGNTTDGTAGSTLALQ
jgi:hypothetical protein